MSLVSKIVETSISGLQNYKKDIAFAFVKSIFKINKSTFLYFKISSKTSVSVISKMLSQFSKITNMLIRLLKLQK